MDDEEIRYRRFDDLGRIVIPKVIRNAIQVKEGDCMKITIDEQGRIILEKCSPV